MENNGDVDLQKLIKNGVPPEIAEKLINTTPSSINTNAAGGKGGSAISLTYVDNYSTLLLVYTFLQSQLDFSDSRSPSYQINKALLRTLETALEEQRQYRKAFLDAVKQLNQNS
ncbi:hypothetical protein [Bacillus sp. T33-2]|uniref:hypothetical protein n=1 Tax=Bacillus sp. T33-2 TaxID=2054168 RepID=UPI000C77A33A|nr:hypothetical protein [Bacillus sp. T33-2]PLR94796.1 hypothetical protein CVD19_16110 [Bacillus sp. T33-2]